MRDIDRDSVLLICNNFPPVRGGSGVVYANLARCAPDRIIVLAPRIGYSDGLPLIGWREHDRMAPFRVARLALLRTVMRVREGKLDKTLFVAKDVMLRLLVAIKVLRLVMQLRPRAICIGELLASGWLLRLLRHVPGIRTLVYVHGEEITTADPYDPDGERRRRALLAADRIVVVSGFSQRAVLALLGTVPPDASDRIVLIENGVDTLRFSPAPRNAELVARYRLDGRFVFLTVCRLLEKKGVDQGLRAFARLHARNPTLRYVIVGTGPYEPVLRDLALVLGITDAVAFAGNVAEHELVDHYRLGDVFVMPNRALANGDTEGFGLVFLEANGCGLPVVAGRDGGSTDAVRDGENGLVVDGNSVEAIEAAMLRLYEDVELRTRLSQQGLKAAQQADWTTRAEAFLQVCMKG